jgi:peroxiredoxin
MVAGLVTAGFCKPPATKTLKIQAPSDLSSLLKDHHGRVLILLVGADGCPGTAKATTALDQYISAKPKSVSVMRLDVPLPKEMHKPTSAWKHSFPRFTDKGRKIADKLEFFYYPTLYVFDGQGMKRYAGACDKGKIARMAREILAEKPGAKKKVYTLPMPAVGKSAPAFSGKMLTGKAATRASLMKKRGLLVIFSRTSCPFSAGEIPQFKDIAGRYRDKGVGVVVVNQEEELGTIKPVYEKKCAGVPVIWDRSGDICKSYGVDAVPFFFLLNEDGKIVARRSFAHPAAVNSINAMLGLKAEKPRFKSTEGG